MYQQFARIHKSLGSSVELLLFPCDQFGQQEIAEPKIPAFVLEQGLPVYRVLYERNETPLPSLEALEQRLEAADNPETSTHPSA